MHYVCSTSIDVLADSEKFPEHWLFKHRWGKGKKNQPSVLPNGDKITFLTVGGRTSAVVPAVQKKTGAVAKEIEVDTNGASSKRKRDLKQENDSDAEEITESKSRGSKRKSNPAVKKEEDEEKKVNVGRRRSMRSKN